MKWATCPATLLICLAMAWDRVQSHDEEDLEWSGITNYKTDFRDVHIGENELIGSLVKRDRRTVEAEEPEEILHRDKRLFFGHTSKQCTSDLELLHGGKSQAQPSYSPAPYWNQQMIDAGGHAPAGLTHAHIVWSGDYYACIKLKVWRNTNRTVDRKPDIVGKYCLGTLGVFVFATPLRVGVCIPESCTGIQAQASLIKNKFPFRVFLEDSFCQTEKAPDWDSTSIVIWWVFFSLASMVLQGTVYEIFLKLIERRRTRRTRRMLAINIEYKAPESPKPNACQQLILGFSALRNTKKIFDTSVSKDDSHLACIHGLKAITMSWVVMGHCCVMLNQIFAWKNGVDIMEYLKVYWLQAIGGAEFSVDTFITITGFLLVLVVVKESKKRGNRFNPFVLYLHRLLRLWPPFALLIAYTVGISAHLPRGPISPAAFIDQDTCRMVWWKALLFIQVYYTQREKCLPHIWYLCIDMFFVLISPIFLFPLIRKPKLGYGILSVLFAVSIIIPFVLIHLHDLGSFPAFNITVQKREQFMHEIYDVPWGRMHCFYIGAAAGYIYYLKQRNLRLNKIYVVLLWAVTCATMFEMVFGTFAYSSGKKPMEHNMKVLYGTFSRPLWAMGLSWIMIACSTGYGGVVNSILSWKGFIPISRLSYSSYLVHFSVIGHFVASAKEPIMVDKYFMFSMIISVFLVTLIFGWMMTIVAEAPIIQAEGLIRRRFAVENKKQPIVSNGPASLPKDQPPNSHQGSVPQQGEVANNAANDSSHLKLELLVESDSEVFWDISESVEKTEKKSE